MRGLSALLFLAAQTVVVSAQELNPTGRTLDLVTPVFQDGRLIGDVALRIGADDALSLDTAGTTAMLGDRINPEAAAAINAAADAQGRAPISAFEAAGAPLTYDPSSLSLVYAPTLAALGERSLSLADERIRSENYIEPARYSAYVNFAGGVQYESGDNDPDGFELDDIDMEGAARAFDVVVEGAVRYDEDDEAFYRRFTRAIYDDPASGNRFIAGDYRTPFGGLVSGSEILGIAVENTGTLRPFDNLRPRGRTRFEIERTSTVEIFTNGILERRVRLEPGIYDLDDIPLTAGANAITVIVEDDQGRREIAAFDQFFDGALLGQGQMLYSVAAGVVSDSGSEEPEYQDRFAFSGQVDYGLTDEITVGAAARVTPEQGVIGVSAATGTRLGSFALDVAGSYSDTVDVGFGGELRWRHEIGRGFAGGNVNPLGGFRNPGLSAVIGARTSDFIDGDPFDLTDQNEEYDFDLSLNYTQPLTDTLGLGLNAFYGHASDRSDDSDRYSLGASLSGSFDDRYTWSLRAEYIEDEDDDDSSFSVGVSVGIRLGRTTSASAFYETRDNRYGGAIRHGQGRGVGAYSVSLATDRSDEDEDIGVTASGSYTANRFVTSVSHRETFDPDTNDREGETALRVGTAIAFADGRVTVGRPVSNSFVIAYPHESLEGRPVTLGRRGADYEAQSGFLPALSSGYGSYRPARVTTDVEDLPLGYDLGAGLVEVEPPYRAGYVVEIGSEAQVTMTGTLVDGDGMPVSLATGIARNLDDPDFAPLQVFTNRSGRFALLGAKPGRYGVEIGGVGSAEVEAPVGAIGLVRVGEITVE